MGSVVDFWGFSPVYGGVGKGAQTRNHLIHSQMVNGSLEKKSFLIILKQDKAF